MEQIIIIILALVIIIVLIIYYKSTINNICYKEPEYFEYAGAGRIYGNVQIVSSS